MMEPRRLSDDGSEVEVRLLRAGRASPPPGSKETALALAAAALSASTGVAGTTAGASTSVAKAAAWTLAKWWMLLCAAGIPAAAAAVVVVHGLRVRRDIAAPPVSAIPTLAVEQAPAPSAMQEPGGRDVALAAPSEPPVAPHPPAAPSARRSGRKPAPAAAATEADPSTVSTEIAMLDEARRAMAAGDAPGALAVVDAYQARFPSGVMTPEATVIRIDALARKGDRQGAARLAAAFLATEPDNVYVARVRSILARSNP